MFYNQAKHRIYYKSVFCQKIVTLLTSLSVVGLQFAIAQYSSGCVIHYSFNQLKTQDSTWESKVTNIPYQNGGSTYTATAILKLV